MRGRPVSEGPDHRSAWLPDHIKFGRACGGMIRTRPYLSGAGNVQLL